MHTLESEVLATSAAHTAAAIRAWLVAAAARLLKVAPATIDTAAPLDSFGIDSVAAFGLTGDLAEWLKRELSATLLWDYPTIDAVAEGLAGSSLADASSWEGIIPFQPAGKAVPLFCFPGQGGHPVTFAALASHLGADQPCYGLTVPGLQGECEPLPTVELIAAAMIRNLRRVQPNGPYQFAGYSFGGLLAYEAAVQLEAGGQEVSLLAIFDTFTRAGRRVRPAWQRAFVHAYLVATQPGKWRYLRDRFNRRAELQREEPAAPLSNDASLIAKAVEQTNIAALESYHAQKYGGHLLAFRAAERESYDVFCKIERDCGWGEYAVGRVRTMELPGNHMTILDADHAAVAAERLSAFLRQPA